MTEVLDLVLNGVPVLYCTIVQERHQFHGCISSAEALLKLRVSNT
jgi:hypothetical protein